MVANIADLITSQFNIIARHMTDHCLDGKSDSLQRQPDSTESGISSAIKDCYSPHNFSQSNYSGDRQSQSGKSETGHLDIPDVFKQLNNNDHMQHHHDHKGHSHVEGHGHHWRHQTTQPSDISTPIIDTTPPITDKPPTVSDGSHHIVGADKLPVGALRQTLSVLDENPTNLSVDYLKSLKAEGISGVRDKYQLPNDRLLNPSELAFLDRDYAAAREAGMPMVTIFSYTQQAGGADAPADLVKAQLAQLAPVLSKNEDTIGAVELGFVGAWGEWNRSTNGNDNNTTLAKDIYDGFSKALPDTPVAFRYVHLVREIFGDNPPANVIMQNDSIGESHGTAWRDKDAGSYNYSGDYEYIVNHNLMTLGENQESGTPAEILKRVQDTNITSMEFWGSVGQAVKSEGMYDDIVAAMRQNALNDGIAF